MDLDNYTHYPSLMTTDAPGPLTLTLDSTELTDTHKHICSFITDQYESAGVDGVVIGLSGGIDSSLTAYLATDALGPARVHGLLLPSSVNPSESTTHAETVATNLGITYDTIPIEPIVSAITEAYNPTGVEEATIGNIRVRVRAVLLYYAANHRNALVLGTGNRSEALVGYFTKYGDGAVDCNPIGTLYKHQVRQLARHLDVPEEIIEKPPSAELWEDHTDEAELGLTYDTIDTILALTIDGPYPPSAVTAHFDDITTADITRVRELYEQSKHKRQLPPTPTPHHYPLE